MTSAQLGREIFLHYLDLYFNYTPLCGYSRELIGKSLSSELYVLGGLAAAW